MKLNLLACVAGMACVVPSAMAFVPWVADSGTGTVGPTGSNTVLAWDGGGSDNGFFGSPVVTADTFLFIANRNFEAESFGDGSTPPSVTTSDTLHVHVHGLNGNAFTEVVFQSQGDYTLAGNGATVNITGQMSISDLNSSNTATDSFHATSSSHGGFPQTGPLNSAYSDTWSGYSLINFASAGLGAISDIDLEFTNSLVAITIGGEHAVIATLPDTQGSFSLQLIPAPGALVTGLLGAGLLARRRRG
jgi:hypothetical protein